jgi:hypothetical protein
MTNLAPSGNVLLLMTGQTDSLHAGYRCLCAELGYQLSLSTRCHSTSCTRQRNTRVMHRSTCR